MIRNDRYTITGSRIGTHTMGGRRPGRVRAALLAILAVVSVARAIGYEHEYTIESNGLSGREDIWMVWVDNDGAVHVDVGRAPDSRSERWTEHAKARIRLDRLRGRSGHRRHNPSFTIEQIDADGLVDTNRRVERGDFSEGSYLGGDADEWYAIPPGGYLRITFRHEGSWRMEATVSTDLQPVPLELAGPVATFEWDYGYGAHDREEEIAWAVWVDANQRIRVDRELPSNEDIRWDGYASVRIRLDSLHEVIKDDHFWSRDDPAFHIVRYRADDAPESVQRLVVGDDRPSHHYVGTLLGGNIDSWHAIPPGGYLAVYYQRGGRRDKRWWRAQTTATVNIGEPLPQPSVVEPAHGFPYAEIASNGYERETAWVAWADADGTVHVERGDLPRRESEPWTGRAGVSVFLGIDTHDHHIRIFDPDDSIFTVEQIDATGEVKSRQTVADVPYIGLVVDGNATGWHTIPPGGYIRVVYRSGAWFRSVRSVRWEHGTGMRARLTVGAAEHLPPLGPEITHAYSDDYRYRDHFEFRRNDVFDLEDDVLYLLDPPDAAAALRLRTNSRHIGVHYELWGAQWPHSDGAFEAFGPGTRLSWDSVYNRASSRWDYVVNTALVPTEYNYLYVRRCHEFGRNGEYYCVNGPPLEVRHGHPIPPTDLNTDQPGTDEVRWSNAATWYRAPAGSANIIQSGPRDLRLRMAATGAELPSGVVEHDFAALFGSQEAEDAYRAGGSHGLATADMFGNYYHRLGTAVFKNFAYDITLRYEDPYDGYRDYTWSDVRWSNVPFDHNDLRFETPGVGAPGIAVGASVEGELSTDGVWLTADPLIRLSEADRQPDGTYHDADGDELFWQLSYDGEAWSDRRSFAHPIGVVRDPETGAPVWLGAAGPNPADPADGAAGISLVIADEGGGGTRLVDRGSQTIRLRVGEWHDGNHDGSWKTPGIAEEAHPLEWHWNEPVEVGMFWDTQPPTFDAPLTVASATGAVPIVVDNIADGATGTGVREILLWNGDGPMPVQTVEVSLDVVADPPRDGVVRLSSDALGAGLAGVGAGTHGVRLRVSGDTSQPFTLELADDTEGGVAPWWPVASVTGEPVEGVYPVRVALVDGVGNRSHAPGAAHTIAAVVDNIPPRADALVAAAEGFYTHNPETIDLALVNYDYRYVSDAVRGAFTASDGSVAYTMTARYTFAAAGSSVETGDIACDGAATPLSGCVIARATVPDLEADPPQPSTVTLRIPVGAAEPNTALHLQLEFADPAGNVRVYRTTAKGGGLAYTTLDDEGSAAHLADAIYTVPASPTWVVDGETGAPAPAQTVTIDGAVALRSLTFDLAIPEARHLESWTIDVYREEHFDPITATGTPFGVWESQGTGAHWRWDSTYTPGGRTNVFAGERFVLAVRGINRGGDPGGARIATVTIPDAPPPAPRFAPHSSALELTELFARLGEATPYRVHTAGDDRYVGPRFAVGLVGLPIYDPDGERITYRLEYRRGDGADAMWLPYGGSATGTETLVAAVPVEVRPEDGPVRVRLTAASGPDAANVTTVASDVAFDVVLDTQAPYAVGERYELPAVTAALTVPVAENFSDDGAGFVEGPVRFIAQDPDGSGARIAASAEFGAEGAAVPFPEGRYDLVLEVHDAVGNIYRRVVPDFVVDRTPPTLAGPLPDLGVTAVAASAVRLEQVAWHDGAPSPPVGEVVNPATGLPEPAAFGDTSSVAGGVVRLEYGFADASESEPTGVRSVGVAGYRDDGIAIGLVMPPEGPRGYVAFLRAVDAAGNAGVWEQVSEVFTVDRTPPTITALEVVGIERSGAVYLPVAQVTPSVEYEIRDASVDGPVTHATADDGLRIEGAWVATDPQTGDWREVRVPEVGRYHYRLRVTDAAGNVAEALRPVVVEDVPDAPTVRLSSDSGFTIGRPFWVEVEYDGSYGAVVLHLAADGTAVPLTAVGREDTTWDAVDGRLWVPASGTATTRIAVRPMPAAGIDLASARVTLAVGVRAVSGGRAGFAAAQEVSFRGGAHVAAEPVGGAWQADGRSVWFAAEEVNREGEERLVGGEFRYQLRTDDGVPLLDESGRPIGGGGAPGGDPIGIFGLSLTHGRTYRLVIDYQYEWPEGEQWVAASPARTETAFTIDAVPPVFEPAAGSIAAYATPDRLWFRWGAGDAHSGLAVADARLVSHLHRAPPKAVYNALIERLEGTVHHDVLIRAYALDETEGVYRLTDGADLAAVRTATAAASLDLGPTLRLSEDQQGVPIPLAAVPGTPWGAHGPADGDEVRVVVSATDWAGNGAQWTSGVAVLDRSAPAAPLLAIGSDAVHPDAGFQVIYGPAADDHSGIAEISWAMAANRAVFESADVQWTAFDPATHEFFGGLLDSAGRALYGGEVWYVALRAVNRAGLHAIAVSDPIRIDESAPVIGEVTVMGGGIDDGSGTVYLPVGGAVTVRTTISDPETAATAAYQVIGGPDGADERWEALAIGAHEPDSATVVIAADDIATSSRIGRGLPSFVRVRAVNAAGLASAVLSRPLLVDIAAPRVAGVVAAAQHRVITADGGLAHAVELGGMEVRWDGYAGGSPIGSYEVNLSKNGQSLLSLPPVVAPDTSIWIDGDAIRGAIAAVGGTLDGAYDWSVRARAVSQLASDGAARATALVDTQIPRPLVELVGGIPAERLPTGVLGYVNDHATLAVRDAAGGVAAVRRIRYRALAPGGDPASAAWKELVLRAQFSLDAELIQTLGHEAFALLDVELENEVGVVAATRAGAVKVDRVAPVVESVVGDMPIWLNAADAGVLGAARDDGAARIRLAAYDATSEVTAYRVLVAGTHGTVTEGYTPTDGEGAWIELGLPAVDRRISHRPVDGTVLIEGPYFATLEVKDAADNRAELTWPFTIDRTAPELVFNVSAFRAAEPTMVEPVTVEFDEDTVEREGVVVNRPDFTVGLSIVEDDARLIHRVVAVAGGDGASGTEVVVGDLPGGGAARTLTTATGSAYGPYQLQVTAFDPAGNGTEYSLPVRHNAPPVVAVSGDDPEGGVLVEGFFTTPGAPTELPAVTGIDTDTVTHLQWSYGNNLTGGTAPERSEVLPLYQQSSAGLGYTRRYYHADPTHMQTVYDGTDEEPLSAAKVRLRDQFGQWSDWRVLSVTVNNTTGGVLWHDEYWSGDHTLVEPVVVGTTPLGAKPSVTLVAGTTVDGDGVRLPPLALMATESAGIVVRTGGLVRSDSDPGGVPPAGGGITMEAVDLSWRGISVEQTGSLYLYDATIEGALRAVTVIGGTAQAVLDRLRLVNNTTAVHAYGAGANLTIGATVISGNSQYGIKEDGAAAPLVYDDTRITDNGVDYYDSVDFVVDVETKLTPSVGGGRQW